MSSLSKKNQWGSALYAVLALVIGLGVLFVSLAKASLQIWAIEDTQNQLRTKPVDFIIKYNNGSTESGNYKLPEIKTLPTSPFYGLKAARNFLWMGLSNGSVDKSKMALLIADKKMTEAKILFETSKSKSGLVSSVEAIDKLKYAYSEISKINEESIEVNQLKSQVIKAGHAYAEVLKQSEKTLREENKDDYKQTVRDLEKWNEEREKEKEKIRN